jgi:hypothetical protein
MHSIVQRTRNEISFKFNFWYFNFESKFSLYSSFVTFETFLAQHNLIYVLNVSFKKENYKYEFLVICSKSENSKKNQTIQTARQVNRVNNIKQQRQ